MTEAEVSLYIALYYIRNGLTDKDVHVSIDGAHVKTGETIHFDILKFYSEQGFLKLDDDTDRWQGKYAVEGFNPNVIVCSTPGVGDVKIETKDGKTILVESKKGKKDKKGQEYPLMREAIGQLMTGSELDESIVPVVAVPYTEKSFQLAERWSKLSQIRNVGIKFFLVQEDGNICVVDR